MLFFMGQQQPKKPVIHYPCQWEYRIIGADPERMRLAVADILGNEDYSLQEANWSRQRRWLSMSLELVVINEAHRYEVHRALREHPDIRMVL